MRITDHEQFEVLEELWDALKSKQGLKITSIEINQN